MALEEAEVALNSGCGLDLLDLQVDLEKASFSNRLIPGVVPSFSCLNNVRDL